MIEVKDLKKYYRGSMAVDGVSFKLKNGGVYGVLTTDETCSHVLLALLSGALVPDDGCVIVNGFDTVREPVPARRSVGYVPRGVEPDANMTPEEFMFFVADAKGLDFEISTRVVQDLLDDAELKGRKHSLCLHLTTAEQRRLLLAQAMVGNPEFLLLEDPTADLGDREARDLAARIYAIGETNTVFVSSTSLATLKALCEEVLVLSEGKLTGIYEIDDPALETVYAAMSGEDGANADRGGYLPVRRKRRSARALKQTKDEDDKA